MFPSFCEIILIIGGESTQLPLFLQIFIVPVQIAY